ncbi:MAG: peptidoglycan bridge formation glycyltransferase FemA/FemB family protein [Clostridia bacterium]|nr:peptidoglycan bridge formation glycyltransferase FemA/FemB family protein [Clostridia bacterium]
MTEFEFVVPLPEEEYRSFVAGLPHCNFMQKDMWAKVKTGWTGVLCGLSREGEIVATAHLLIRRLPTGQKLIYSPRGFLLDYSDKDILDRFTSEVRGYAKSIGAYMVRIDPEIVLSRKYKGEAVKDDVGYNALELLKNSGWKHMGFATDFHSYTQPRFNAEYPLVRDGQPQSDDEMVKGFDKKIRKFVGAYTEKRGIFFTCGNSEEDIKLFCDISSHTEERQHILLRDSAYFSRMTEAYGEDCMFFFAKMDLHKFIAFLDTQPQDEQTQKDREEAERWLEHGDVVPMSALQMIRSNDTAYLLYSGFDDRVFPRFRTTNQIRYEAMKYFRDRGCSVFSFMGIKGDLNDPLSDFKLKFNPTVVEYIGELELPVRPILYRFMNKFLPFAKRVYIRAALLIKGKK